MLVLSAFVLLSLHYPSLIYILPITISILREVAISSLREWMASQGMRDAVKVGFVGKVKTTLQMVSIIVLMFSIPQSLLCPSNLKHVALSIGLSSLYLSTIASVLSAWIYFKAAGPQLLKDM